jgi:hypothetical protein
MEQGVRGAILKRNAATQGRTEARGSPDERAFRRVERAEAGGVRDACCPWKESKGALVAAGYSWTAIAVHLTENYCR